jgi:hypothetical protein
LQNPTTSTSQHAVYQDGAWIAVDEGYEAMYNEDDEFDDPDLQELYYKMLIKRFETLRRTLRNPEVYKSGQKSDVEANQSTPVNPPSNRHDWLYILDREFPTLAQISQLDEKNIRRGIEYCVNAMDRFDTISDQKSCWIWTLLALSSDIETLDSRKMSHIRDLGNKASQLSISLHQGVVRQKFEDEHDLLYPEPAVEGLDNNLEVNKAGPYKAKVEDDSSGTGPVRLVANEHTEFTAENTSNEHPSETQSGVQTQTRDSDAPGISADTGESSDIGTNDDSLERARARLLAQLGDNLVQAGIPTSAQTLNNTDKMRRNNNEQLHPNSDDVQHEIKTRVLPSRAEAERQRQMMRKQNSSTDAVKVGNSSHSECSVDVPAVAEDHSSYPVDSNTRITIDMILTVVAECYGQKDLLKSRKPW